MFRRNLRDRGIVGNIRVRDRGNLGIVPEIGVVGIHWEFLLLCDFIVAKTCEEIMYLGKRNLKFVSMVLFSF